MKSVPVDGFENFLISKSGRLFKKLKKRIKEIKLFRDHDGYLVTAVQNNKKRISIKVHRIVAAAFLDINISGKEINHIDGNKENNDVSNLEIVSRQDNILHALRTKLIDNRGSLNGNAKLDEEKVLTIKTLIHSGWKNKDICKTFDVAPHTISQIRHGTRWKHV